MTLKATTSDAAAGLAAASRAVSPAGLVSVAESLTETLAQASERAFAQKVDPATGRPWEPASPLTAGSRTFKSLLVRSGALQAAVIAETYKGPTSAFARAGLDSAERSVLVRGLVHHYGVTKRSRRSNRTARVRPQQTSPARRFVGLSAADIANFVKDAEAAIAGAAE